MNSLERRMVEVLLELKEVHHCAGVKAEFEAEGTRLEEAMRLKEIAAEARLPLTIKIGGCEAIKDMFEARSLGTKYLLAPMVETPYALSKYLGAVRIAFSDDELATMELLINVETITTVRNFEQMMTTVPEIGRLAGIVIGRVDLSGSLGLGRDATNSAEIQSLAHEVAAIAKAHGKKVVVGGGVSYHSLPFMRSFPPGHLDRFETRKIVFQCPGALDNREEGFMKAVEFEITWLKNKKNHYGSIYREDDARLAMMEQRYQAAIDAIVRRK